MNIRVSFLALLIFVSPLCVAQEVQEKTSKRNTIKTAVITVGSIIVGAFLAYVGYRYFGNFNKVSAPAKPASQDKPTPAQPKEVEKSKLSPELNKVSAPAKPKSQDKPIPAQPKEEVVKAKLTPEQQRGLEIMLEDTRKRSAELEKLVESSVESFEKTARAFRQQGK